MSHGVSGFLKGTKSSIDKASTKGRTYVQNRNSYSTKNNTDTATVDARPLTALSDPKSFPAPPVHRVAHGEAPRPPPQAPAPAPTQQYQSYQQQPAATSGYPPPYQPPGHPQQPAAVGFQPPQLPPGHPQHPATTGFTPPGQPQPQSAYQQPTASFPPPQSFPPPPALQGQVASPSPPPPVPYRNSLSDPSTAVPPSALPPRSSVPDVGSFPPPPPIIHSSRPSASAPSQATAPAHPPLPPRTAGFAPSPPPRSNSTVSPLTVPAISSTPNATGHPVVKKKAPAPPPKKPANLTTAAATSIASRYFHSSSGNDNVDSSASEAPPPYTPVSNEALEPSPSSSGAGGAARLARQFEQMNFDMAAELQRRNTGLTSRPTTAPSANTSSTTVPDHSVIASTVHNKKAPPKPPKKGNLVGGNLSASSTGHSTASNDSPLPFRLPSTSGPSYGASISGASDSLASAVAAVHAAGPHRASVSSISSDHGPPPPINYSTRPDISTNTQPVPATPAVLPIPHPVGANKNDPNDPNGQFDLNLSSLWFTQSARSLTLPPSLQGLNHTYAVSSSGNSRTLILALRISENLSIVKFKLEWQSTSPLNTVTVSRIDVPPPAPLPQHQLAQARDQFNESVAAYAESARNTQVGDGECWTLGQQALAATPGAMLPQGYTFGPVVYEAEAGATAPIAYTDRIARGDIIQFLSARFETKSPQGFITKQMMVGAPHHTSVIVNVSADNRTVDVLHQNVGGIRTVQPGEFNLDEISAGHITIYRPVWKEWAGELDTEWK